MEKLAARDMGCLTALKIFQCHDKAELKQPIRGTAMLMSTSHVCKQLYNKREFRDMLGKKNMKAVNSRKCALSHDLEDN